MVISKYLLSVVRCPICVATLTGEAGGLRCESCGLLYPFVEGDAYLDFLTPVGSASDLTEYAEEEFHHRTGPLRPPFLSAGVKIDQMRRMLGLSGRDRVLDIGCGNGRAVFFVRSSCDQVVAIDAGHHFASEAMATVDLTRGDIRRLPYASGSFDKAYSLDVVEHLTEDGVRAMLDEARRVLRPGGLLFIYSHVMMSSRLAAFQRGIHGVVNWLDRRGWVDNRPERARKADHRNPLRSYEQLDTLIGEAGFRMEKILYYNVVVKAVVEDLLLPLLEHNFWGRKGKRGALERKPGPSPSTKAAGSTPRPDVGRWAHGPLALATALMKLDVVLFGRVRTGPFFLLLRNVGSP